MPKLSTAPIHNINPHYTNDRFRDAQLVWGSANVKNGGWDYSDRILQWDYDKATKAWDKARAKFTPNSPAFFQEYLRIFFDAPNLELVGVQAGFNVSNGYPYQVFGYRTNK
jgi:hypothetical protein